MTRTFFVDLDGVVLRKHSCGGEQHWTWEVLDHGREQLQRLAHEGATVILCTGRRENQRQVLEQVLVDERVPYDLLIMGLGGGERVVVNDSSSLGSVRARAIAVEANQPWATG